MHSRNLSLQILAFRMISFCSLRQKERKRFPFDKSFCQDDIFFTPLIEVKDTGDL